MGILLVDDEQNILKSLSRLLKSRTSHRVETAGSGREALELMESRAADIIVSDERMPDMRGSELLTRIREHFPDTVRIIITGYADTQAILHAVNDGNIYRFLKKPWDNEEFLEVIQSAAEHLRISRENVRLQRELSIRNSELEKLNIELEARVEKRTRELRSSYVKLKQAYTALNRQNASVLELIHSILHFSRPHLASRASRASGLVQLFQDFPGLEEGEFSKLKNSAMLHTAAGLKEESDAATPWRDLAASSASMLHAFYRLNHHGELLSRAAEIPLPQSGPETSQPPGALAGAAPGSSVNDEPSGILRLILDFDEQVRSLEHDPEGGIDGQSIMERAFVLVTGKPLPPPDSPGGEDGENMLSDAEQWFLNKLRSKFNWKERKVKTLSPDQLIPGHRLARGIHLKTGSMVLPEGTDLTQEQIDNLKRIFRLLKEDIAVFS
ncbi:hypothetical protein L21SP2_2159 [Salinispira pacifica]|uniref:Response regulatory domain-containing protein n=1 Tax=Salinispira pacifica TaxID=1307761 RepID=V5WI88_9SPIO|nr:hypothetical protein L21SP2_2159 [Salinispira pacifica]